MFQKDKKGHEKARVFDVSSNRKVEHTPWRCFRCGSEYHMTAKFPKQVCLNEKGNYACNNGENNSYCDIYVSMAQISSNDKWKNHGKTEN